MCTPSLAQVSAKSQKMGMEIYLKHFERSAKRIKNRASCRLSVSDWRMLHWRCALFIKTLEDLSLNAKVEEEELDKYCSMFIDGDFTDEFNNFLIAMPADFDYTKTGLYNPRRASTIAMASVADAVNEAERAEEEAVDAKFRESEKKVHADVTAWTKFIASARSDKLHQEVCKIVHSRNQYTRGKIYVPNSWIATPRSCWQMAMD